MDSIEKVIKGYSQSAVIFTNFLPLLTIHHFNYLFYSLKPFPSFCT